MKNHYNERPLIDTAVPACFIERADVVQGLARVLITQWLNAINIGVAGQHRHYDTYISIEITKARDNAQLWNAIESSKHIWLSSAFALSESAELFAHVVREAVIRNVRDKWVFNWADRTEAMYHLGSSSSDSIRMLKVLETNQNIRFLYWDEIAAAMRNLPPTRGDPT